MDIYNFNIFNLYSIAVLEGEGWGTAYEYCAKLPFLNRLFEKTCAKKVMILGLPEKYGFSMDFILYCYFNKINRIIVIDERKEKIDDFSKVLKNVSAHLGISPNIEMKKVNSWSEIQTDPVDVIMSSEVLQRLDNISKNAYIKFILKNAKNYIIFVPNGKNQAHESISGLKTLYLKQLMWIFKKTKFTGSGYLDCPPNPPGISFKNKSSESNSIKNKMKNIVVAWPLLVWYYMFEKKLSFLLKNLFEKNAHIIFVAGEIFGNEVELKHEELFPLD